MKESKEETIHLSVKIDREIAKAARIQAIREGVSFKEWITQAFTRRLAETEPPKGAA